MPSTIRHYAAPSPRSAAYCLSGRNHSPGNPFQRGQQKMRTVRWLVAAGLLVSATACVETNGYPGTSYGGYPSGYGGYPSSGYYGQPAYSSGSGLFGSLFNQQPSYYQQPTYYQPPPRVVTQTRYVPVPTASQRPYGSRSS